MDIYTKKGLKVIGDFDDNGVIKNGYDTQREFAGKYIKPNVLYTVKEINIESFSSTVEFKEFPDVRFNTVHFKNVP